MSGVIKLKECAQKLKFRTKDWKTQPASSNFIQQNDWSVYKNCVKNRLYNDIMRTKEDFYEYVRDIELEFATEIGEI